MKMLLIILALVSIAVHHSVAQGTNNDHPLDSIDIKNCFHLLGMEVFKFPIEPQDTNYQVNVIFEMYEEHKLADSIIINANSLQGLPAHLLNNFIGVDKENGMTMRFYSKQESDSSFIIQTSYPSILQTMEFIEDPDSIRMSGWRAFNDQNVVPGKRIPVLLRYAVGYDTETLDCPKWHSPEEVAKLYKSCLIIYLELVKPEEIVIDEKTLQKYMIHPREE
jgi:hypothetical protein